MYQVHQMYSVVCEIGAYENLKTISSKVKLPVQKIS